jgi:hypothetical protein
MPRAPSFQVESASALRPLILSMILSEKSATFWDHGMVSILSMILSEKSATFRDHALVPILPRKRQHDREGGSMGTDRAYLHEERRVI